MFVKKQSHIFFVIFSGTVPLWIGLKVETQRSWQSWVRVATRKFVWFQETAPNRTVYEERGYFRTGDIQTQYIRTGIQSECK